MEEKERQDITDTKGKGGSSDVSYLAYDVK